jgi:hypothetical protein
VHIKLDQNSLRTPAPFSMLFTTGRWSIEDTFKNTKQSLGSEEPQTWKGQWPERAAVISLWLYSVVWA